MLKKTVQYFRHRLTDPNLDFRCRLFNILAMTGIAVSITSVVGCIINNESLLSMFINGFSGVVALALLEYAYHTGHYRRCYFLAIIAIFLILFPIIYFVGGGYHSGMPSFFIFAVVFTFFMIQGWASVLIVALELAVYIGICIFSYYYPHTVTTLSTERAILYDNITGFTFAALSLGIAMMAHIVLYDKQARELTRAREDALHLSQAKSQFLANVSHEIRTPINIILGMNEMILRSNSAPAVGEYARSIASAGKTLRSIINDILDISKIESGRFDLVEEPYRLEDLINELSMVAKAQADRKGLSFQIETGRALPTELYGGYIHIKQILTNFLVNAVKYTFSGEITLRVRAFQNDHADTVLLRFEVEDTGIGIKQEDLPALFHTFSRINADAHRDIEGVGLGLAIAKELADLLGAGIYVDSTWQQGSVFALEVAQAVSHNQISGEVKPGLPNSESDSETILFAPNCRILVVDDNKDNLKIIRLLLERTQIQVDTAQTVPECIEAAAACSYHAIIMDYMLPDMNGLELLRHLQANAVQPLPPVIALTANTLPEVSQQFIESGCFACLAKPVSGQALEHALIACLPRELTRERPVALPPGRARPEIDGINEMPQSRSISVENALLYLGGDFTQYRRMVDIFTASHEKSRTEAQAAFEAQNWDTLTHIVHSLKSSALTVGAVELHQIALLIEEGCREGDYEYVTCSVPLLLLKWKRVAEELHMFLAPVYTPPAQTDTAESIGELEQRLLTALQCFHHKDAEQTLSRLLAAKSDEDRRLLLDIKAMLSTLNFEAAESLLSAHLMQRW